MPDLSLPPQSVAVHELLLERLRVASQIGIGQQVLRDIEISTSDVLGFAFDQLIVQLKTEILADRLVDKRQRVEFSFPSSAWQHVKQRLFPRLGGLGRWLLRLAPVTETTKCVSIDFREYATFPMNDTIYPKTLGRSVRLQQLEVSPAWTEQEENDA